MADYISNINYWYTEQNRCIIYASHKHYIEEVKPSIKKNTYYSFCLFKTQEQTEHVDGNRSQTSSGLFGKLTECEGDLQGSAVLTWEMGI